MQEVEVKVLERLVVGSNLLRTTPHLCKPDYAWQQKRTFLEQRELSGDSRM